MKNIKLKFLGVGYNEYYQANVSIYDKYDNCIYIGQTYNGEINVVLRNNNLYKLVSQFLNCYICTFFYVQDNCKFLFSFNKLPDSTNTVTFLLTDYYYNNLPIMKGELKLWQK